MAYVQQNHSGSGGLALIFGTEAAQRFYRKQASFRARAGLNMKGPRDLYLLMLAAGLVPIVLYMGQPSLAEYPVLTFLFTLAAAAIAAALVYVVWMIVMVIWRATLKSRLTSAQLNKAVGRHEVTPMEAMTKRDQNLQAFYNVVPGAVMGAEAVLATGDGVWAYAAMGGTMAAGQYRSRAQYWQGVLNRLQMGERIWIEDAPPYYRVGFFGWMAAIVIAASIMAAIF